MHAFESRQPAESLFDSYAVVGAVSPLEPTEETITAWKDRATDVIDIALIRDDEETPEGFVALRWTPSGATAAIPTASSKQSETSASLKAGAQGTKGSLDEQHQLFLCIKRRGRDRRSEDCTFVSAEPAVTQIQIAGAEKKANATQLSLDGGRTKQRPVQTGAFAAGLHLFGSRLKPRRAATNATADDETSAVWKRIEKTPAGHSAKLRVGYLLVRFARPNDTPSRPLLDVCVTRVGEKAPRGFEEEAVVVKPGGLISSSSRICVRPGALCGACDVTWRATVLDYYPRPVQNKQSDGDDNGGLSTGLSSGSFELDVLPMLTWPHGLRLERAPASVPPPIRYVPYTLSGDPRRPIYVSSLIFYEPLPPEQRTRARSLTTDLDNREENSGTVEDRAMVLYVPKCICLLTRCAGVAEGARRWLAALYTLALSALEMPLEHVIAHAVGRIPAPIRGGAPLSIRVNPSLPPIEIKLARQPPNAELPPLGASASIRSLFACFEPQDAVAAFNAALLERRLLLVSKRAALVSDVAEALRALLFPLRWEGVYIPRLARPIAETLDFPGAILAGVDAGDRGQEFADFAVRKARDLGGYVILFLDEGRVEYTAGVDAHAESASGRTSGLASSFFSKSPLLPEPLASSLVRRWTKVADIAGVSPCDRDRAVAEEVFDNAPAPSALRFNRRRANNKSFYDSSDDDRDDYGPPEWTSGCERAARDAALTTMVCVLDGYSDHLIVPHVNYYAVSAASLFDIEKFVRSPKCASSILQFRRRISSTQSWSRFIQRRIETSDPDLVLFDECMQALGEATEAHRNAILRGDTLLLDSVDAAHYMKRLLAKKSDVAMPLEGSGANGMKMTRSDRLSWHMESSRWQDEQLLRSAMAQDAECTYGKDTRGRPRIEVPPPQPFSGLLENDCTNNERASQSLKSASGKRYSYFVLGRGLRWPCPLDSKLLPPISKSQESQQMRMMPSRISKNLRMNSTESLSAQTLARSQAELLLDMGLSVGGLRLGGGKAPPSPTSSGSWRERNLDNDSNPARATAARQLLHAYGAWFLFAPALVRVFSSQTASTNRKCSATLCDISNGLHGAPAPMLVALGVLHCVLDAPCEPDEAIFRALLVAAGRSGLACKPIVADLFSHLRSKGIRPNALTFGQYTRAIAQRDFYMSSAEFPPRMSRCDHENDPDPILIANLASDALGGTSVAELMRDGLEHHLRLSGLAETIRIAVRLAKPMGIIFEERPPPLRGAFVQMLTEDGAAARNTIVKRGDVLVSVGDIPCDEADFGTCMDLIERCVSPMVELVFERPRKPLRRHIAKKNTETQSRDVVKAQDDTADNHLTAVGEPISTAARTKDPHPESAGESTGSIECDRSEPDYLRGSPLFADKSADHVAESTAHKGDGFETPPSTETTNGQSMVPNAEDLSESNSDGFANATSRYGDTTTSNANASRNRVVPHVQLHNAPDIDNGDANSEIISVSKNSSSPCCPGSADEKDAAIERVNGVDSAGVGMHADERAIARSPSPVRICIEETSSTYGTSENDEGTRQATDHSLVDIVDSRSPPTGLRTTTLKEDEDEEPNARQQATSPAAATQPGNDQPVSKVIGESHEGTEPTSITHDCTKICEESGSAAQSDDVVDSSNPSYDFLHQDASPSNIQGPRSKEIISSNEIAPPGPTDLDLSDIKSKATKPAPKADEGVLPSTQDNSESSVKNSSDDDLQMRSQSSSGSRVNFFVPSRESLAKAAAAFGGMTKASTVNAARVLGNAGGTAYDNAAKRLAYLVDEADVPYDVAYDIEPGEPRLSACVSGFLVDLLTRHGYLPANSSHDTAGAASVAVIWSGCASPHHPREPPLDEDIMAAWPEELGQREVRCSFTSRAYEPQLAYAVLEAVEPPGEIPDEHQEGDLYVRLWRPSWRNPGSPAALSEPDASSSGLVAAHPAELSISDFGISIAPQRDTRHTPVRLSTLMRAAGIEVDVPGGSVPGAAVNFDEGNAGGNPPESRDSEDDAELRQANCELSEGVGRCAYLSPLQLRYELELQVQRYGERALDEKTLALEKPALFWSLWWYCSRLNLPFPALPTIPNSSHRQSHENQQLFAGPRVAVVAWSRRGALAGAADALRAMCCKKHAGVTVAAAEALKLDPFALRLLEPVRDALLGFSTSSKRFSLRRLSPYERVHDACALYVEARSFATRVGIDTLNRAFFTDMYRSLLRLNEPLLDGSIPTTGPLVPKRPVDDAFSVSLFDNAYRDAIARLHRDGAEGLQGRDGPPSERAIIFRSVFGHLY